MVIGAPAERPVVLALALADKRIVDASEPHAHEPLLVEFPILVAVAAVPLAPIVVPLVRKTHGNPVLATTPYLLDQTVVQLAIPFSDQERLDRLAALKEFRAIAPAAIPRVCQHDAGGISGIPRVFRHPHLLRGGLEREQR
jgi:hypothetical protein